jgi:hypothetical protein
MELYDVRQLKRLRTWKVEGPDPADHVEFNPYSKRFQFTSKRGPQQIVLELDSKGTWLPIGNVPGIDILISLPVKGGTLINTFEPRKASTYLVRPDKSKRLIANQFVEGDASATGDVVYADPDSPAGSESDRILLLRASSDVPELIVQTKNAWRPTISPDGHRVVYFSFPGGRVFHCPLLNDGRKVSCEMIFADPEMYSSGGALGPDGTSILYVATEGGRWSLLRSIRVLSVRTRKFRDLGKMQVECLTWASDHSLWVLLEGAREYQEFDVTSGQRLARTWPVDPVARCEQPPPSVRTAYTIRSELPWDVRFAPNPVD